MAKTKTKTITTQKTSHRSKNSDLENPFDSLLGNNSSSQPLNLKSIQKKNSRGRERLKFSGNATLYDLNQKVICRAALRNISPGGLGFEILPKPVHKNLQVFVQIDTPRLDLGMILCTVQWVAEIVGNPNKMVGLKINRITPSLQKKMEIAFNFSIED